MLDIIFLVILVLAVIKGFQRGLILGVFSLLAIIIGLAAAIRLSAAVAHRIGSAVNVSDRWLPVISFIIVFLIVLLLIRWGARLLQKTVEMATLGWANRLGGIVLYAVVFTIVYSILLFYAVQLHLIKPETIERSATYAFVQPWGPKAINGLGRLIPLFRDMFTGLESFFGGVAQQLP
ncbi:MAG: CvpA family protein [Chitinophagaceae bacterium]